MPSKHIELDHQYSVQCFPKRQDIVITGSNGSKLIDDSGNEYLDLFSGISVNNVGNNHPDVVKAIKHQVDRYMHVSNYYFNDVSPKLAEKMAHITPNNLTRTYFSNSGTEAVDGAVKLAKKHSSINNKSGHLLFSLEGSFHGRLSLTLGLTGQKKYRKLFDNYVYPGIIYGPAPYFYRDTENLDEIDFGKKCAENLDKLMSECNEGDISALIIEPIFGEGGIIVPPDNYIPLLQRICRSHDVLLIIDEVQTGIARTGKMFCCEHWNVTPDIMTFAKGIGGGLPIGGFITSDEIASSFEEGDHFSTFGSNPVSCASSLAVIDVVEKNNLSERSEKLGNHVIRRLNELSQKHSLIGDIRGKGLMIGIELVTDTVSKNPASQEALLLKNKMLSNGFLIGLGGIFGNVLRFQPPLTISMDDLDFALDSFGNLLDGL